MMLKGDDIRGLDYLFAPRRVAVIGATEKGAIGRSIIWNLIKTWQKEAVHVVDPMRRRVLGMKAYKNVASIPDPIDLAVIVTPASTVPGVISECVNASVPGAIVMSAGFRETGPEGARLEQELLKEARLGRMRIIGPNSLGLMRPYSGLNATVTHAVVQPGNIAFLSQSKAVGAAVLGWCPSANVGLSGFVSVGSMLDIGWGDLIDFFGDDPYTKSILIFMEAIGDARSFLSAAREVALAKPIIVIKPGHAEVAAKAAASHTGVLTGSDEVVDAAFRRVGVLRVNSISQVFDMAEVLAEQPRPKGPRLAILTNAGGPGVLATDALIESNGELAPISAETMAALNAVLPDAWSHGNPINIPGDAGPNRYSRAMEIADRDPSTDGLLVILTAQPGTYPARTAEKLKSHAERTSKGYDLRLMSSVNDVSGIPTKGKRLIIVAAVNNVLHFRIFDGDGKVVVDTDEKRLTDQAQQIENLRKQLESLWPPHGLTSSEKDRVVTAVTSIAGHTPSKPVLASWMGGDDVATGKAILKKAGIPTFDHPDNAARAFTTMWRLSYNLQELYETPDRPVDSETATNAREAQRRS